VLVLVLVLVLVVLVVPELPVPRFMFLLCHLVPFLRGRELN
jgi:hypothetical protein